MAHFAQLDDGNIVTNVIVVANEELMDNGVESETKGVVFCQSLFGGQWKQTSYNGKFRKHYAGIGYTYDAERDAFIPPKPYPSWVLNEDTYLWDSPVPMPTDGKGYYWDEITQTWIEVIHGS
jgi:hypothetical protein